MMKAVLLLASLAGGASVFEVQDVCPPCTTGPCCNTGQMCPGQIPCCECTNPQGCNCPSNTPTPPPTPPPTPTPPTPANPTPPSPTPTPPTPGTPTPPPPPTPVPPPTPFEPNPPTWPSTVRVFKPTDPDIQQVITAAFAQNGGHDPADHGAWSNERFAFLFEPGEYSQDVPVGFYTTIHGLGESPSDVTFTGPKGVFCEEGDYEFVVGALNSFWRGAENFRTSSTFPWFSGPEGSGVLWAASQASPMRRVQVDHDLVLFQYTYGDAAGFASGGFLANMQIGGTVHSGSQQQYLTRNSKVGQWEGGVWNMVFVGVDNAPAGHCGAVAGSQTIDPIVNIPLTPVVAEKPFITITSEGKYNLQVPQLLKNSHGADHTLTNVKTIGFEHVYVASASDSASAINAKLASGKHVVLSPGIYQLDEPLKLATNNQVLLGLGMATLISTQGAPVVVVPSGVDGARVAGLLIQAGPNPTNVLLQWGQQSDRLYQGDPANPGFLYDIFARVGGPADNTTKQTFNANTIVEINSGNVVGDNMWLWRADHINPNVLILNGTNPVKNGAVINANDVTMYGLAIEHTLEDLLVWNGERGQVFFYQSELPYDVTQAQFGDKGFAGYRVSDTVKAHEAHGVGVYHYFRDYNVTVETGIVCPPALESSFESPFAVFLNGTGTMSHIINNKGNVTSPYSPSSEPGAHPAWYCS